ncbi:MAG: hypoxanthine phosphoribosyltransferase [Dehalococcoidia bacterium]
MPPEQRNAKLDARPGTALARAMDEDIAEVLISAEALKRRVKEIGAAIDRDFFGQEPVLVTILQGALVFAADLMRSIQQHLQLSSILVSSYPFGKQRAPEPQIVADLQIDIQGRHVILVEDIVDSGNTLRVLLDRLQQRNPASLSVATLLDKPSGRETSVPLRYIGFEVPAAFVVGYGLDYSGRYRNLPYIGALRGERIHER